MRTTRDVRRVASVASVGVVLALIAGGLLFVPSSAPAVVGGSITGTVVDASSTIGIEEVEVCAYGGPGSGFGCDVTNVGGEYAIAGLGSGSYIVEFWPEEGVNYQRQFYDGKATFAQADEVSVTAGATTSGVDAELHEGGLIEGTVIDAVGKTGIKNILVCAYGTGESEAEFGCTLTDTGGDYTIAGLPSASYKVEFWGGYEGLNYLTQFHSGKSSFAQANPVSVAVGATTSNINAEMSPGGQIKGKVTDASTNAAIEGVEVCIHTATAAFVGCAITNAGGEYTLARLSGSYKVEFWAGALDYVTQFYNGKSTLAQADSISVVAPGIVSGVDAHLSKKPSPAIPLTPSQTSTILPAPALQVAKGPRCRKGFKRMKKRGKTVCVKVKKQRRKHKAR